MGPRKLLRRFTTSTILLASMVPTAAWAQQAVTIPWVPSNPTVPHVTYSGFATTLKGVARSTSSGAQYYWNYGDGQQSALTTIVDPYNLGVKHAYVGSPGQMFFATLVVRQSGVDYLASYPIVIRDYSAANPTPIQLETKIATAIDEGLWYLHTNLTRATFAAGAPGYGQPYGRYQTSDFITSCRGLEAFEQHGSAVGASSSTDPYAEDVQRLYTYLFFNLQTQPISSQPFGNPDTNGNGLGVSTINPGFEGAGYCDAVFANTRTPEYIASVGTAGIYGRSVRSLVQDMVDWWSFAQNDSGPAEGGWGYNPNDGGSNNLDAGQWVPVALDRAEQSLGATVPAFVKSELTKWWIATRWGQAGSNCGGWDFYRGSNFVLLRETASALVQAHLLGRTADDPLVKGGLGFMYAHWNDTGSWAPTLGNSMTMSLVDNGLRAFQPDIAGVTNYACDGSGGTTSFDWYDAQPVGGLRAGLATYLVGAQAADGSWSDTAGADLFNGADATGLDVTTLLRAICGDGVVSAGEECDEGAANGGANCCTADCRLRPANTVCRASTGTCDLGGLCDGAAGTCPASSPAADGTSCSDGDACNGAETCQAGSCAAGTPLSCDDGDPCTTNSCDPAAGCLFDAAPDGTNCDDGDACTTTDTCQVGTCTSGTPVTCVPPDECHDSGVCDPESGQCSIVAKPDGAACSGGTCIAGVCTASSSSSSSSSVASSTSSSGTGGGGGASSSASSSGAGGVGGASSSASSSGGAGGGGGASTSASSSGGAGGGGGGAPTGSSSSNGAGGGGGPATSGSTGDVGGGSSSGGGSSGDCGCRAAGATHDSGEAWLLAVGLGLVLGRRQGAGRRRIRRA